MRTFRSYKELEDYVKHSGKGESDFQIDRDIYRNIHWNKVKIGSEYYMEGTLPDGHAEFRYRVHNIPDIEHGCKPDEHWVEPHITHTKYGERTYVKGFCAKDPER